ncbi:MAG TPA: helix-turn-helix domain-containing protein [Pseudonocardiaceae bacterium]|jgi:excisionase family DNA binding protein|nr:helix-turn-helix domain-containing protein [Pseudonocardiaceae bacterium]
MRDLWGPKELSDYLGVPVQTIYQWRTRGYGPRGHRIGKHLRFKPEDAEFWVESQGTGGA